MQLQPFNEFYYTEGFDFLQRAYKLITNKIKMALGKLKAGQKARIPLDYSGGVLSENTGISKGGGGAFVSLVGKVAESITATEVINNIDKYNAAYGTKIKYDPANREHLRQVANEQLRWVHNLLKTVKTKDWDGTYLNPKGQKKNAMGSKEADWKPGDPIDPSILASRAGYVTSIVPNLKKKCVNQSKGIFKVAVENLTDHDLTEWRVDLTGFEMGKTDVGTSDLVINKMEKGKVAKHLGFSLKTILGNPKLGTRGTTIQGPFGIIASVLGIAQPRKGNYTKLLEALPVKEYGSKVKDILKDLSELDKKKDQIMKVRKMSAEDWHAWCRENYGHDAVTLSNIIWVRVMHELAKDKKQEMCQELLTRFDLKPDSPILVATGEDKKGEIITTIKSPSPEILKEWDKQIKSFRLELEYDEEKSASAALRFRFTLNGEEIATLGGQMYSYKLGALGGGCIQMKSGGTDELYKEEDLENEIKTLYDKLS